MKLAGEFRGEVVGINRRCNFQSASNTLYEVRSCIEFELGSNMRMQMEIPGNHALGTRFKLTLQEEIEIQ